MGNAIDKAFKDAAKNHKVQPSPDLWAKMEASLDAKAKTPKRAYWNYAIAAALVLLIGIPAFMVVQDQGSQLYLERVAPVDLAGVEPKEVLPEIILPKAELALVASMETKPKVGSTSTAKKEVAVVAETPELALVKPKEKKVIHAFVRPIRTLASAEAAINTEPEAVQEKGKVTVKSVFNKLKELKRGELNLPRNISFNLPKPELFASK